MPLADTIGRVTDRQPWISVTATGEASVAPDLALVTFIVSASGRELPPLRDEVITRGSAVLARLRELEVPESDLNAPDLTIQPEYDYSRGQRLVGYRVARQMTVRVRDLERLGAVLDGIVDAGANEVQGAQMSTSDPSAAEHAALASAVEAARAKAKALASAAGVTLGRVSRIEEEPGFGDGPMPMFRAAAESAAAATEVVTGELTVSRRIRAWFSID
jgi:uncharacterized protein YggE